MGSIFDIFAVRNLCPMISIKTFVFNSFMVNTYVLYDETREAIVVDAACSDTREEDQFSQFIASNHLKLVHNINTHCHIDHILGNAFIEKEYGLKPEYHKASEPFLATAPEVGASFGYQLAVVPRAGTLLHDGEFVDFGHSGLEVLYTPGHADGSICLYNEPQDFVITGDVLFRGSVGRTDLPSGNLSLLMEGIRKKLYTLPDKTVVYPGHGPETTIGFEKENNPFVR